MSFVLNDASMQNNISKHKTACRTADIPGDGGIQEAVHLPERSRDHPLHTAQEIPCRPYAGAWADPEQAVLWM